jgi:predicted permease
VTTDVRYGVRMIRKAPGVSAVAIASLAVGIGASTILFSVANAVLFRPIHAARPEQVLQLFTSNTDGSPYGGSSYADYDAFRDLPVFEGLVASTRATATVSALDRRDVVDGLLVSANYFDVLGLHPSRGRFFRPEEGQTGSEAVVVLSHTAWLRRFVGDEATLGRVIELNGHGFTVIGVAPPGFAGTSIEHAADFFVPATMQHVISPGADLLGNRRARVFRVYGRLGSGVSQRQAEAALGVTAAQLLEHDPDAWRDQNGRGRVTTLLPEITARFVGAPAGSVLVLFSSVIAAVVTLLAIACVNVATVLLATASTRRTEIAVRLAIGASRRRVVCQLLTECALLTAAGSALGVAMAQAAAALFVRFRPDGVPPLDLTLDPRILVFSIGASVLTVVLCGLAPALQATRPDVNAELKDTTRPVRVRGWRFNLRSGLVVTQVALSLALVTGSALMLRSLQAAHTADPGFRRDGVLSVGLDLSAIPDRDGAHARVYDDAVRSVAALSGVERVALAALVPLDGTNRQMRLQIASDGPPISTAPDVNVVGPGYFGLLDIPVARGREFTSADGRTSPGVAVVNERMAREYWDGDALGQVLTIQRSGESVQVVGVVRDLRHRSFGEEPKPMVYFPASQRPGARMTLHVRSAARPEAIGPAIHGVLRDINRAAGITPVETMNAYFDRVTLPQRLGAAAAIALAVLELALVVMALYGVIAFAASQRTREIGLRIALGATTRSVLVLIMREGLLLTLVGVSLGLGLAAIAGAGLSSLLVGIGPVDPVSFGGAVVAVLLVGAAASYVPARRALGVDPSTALRIH